jgi:hypothetical protein
MREEWALAVLEQCQAARVPFFFKQVGSIGFDGVRRSKTASGRELAGRLWEQCPDYAQRYAERLGEPHERSEAAAPAGELPESDAA